LDSHRTNLVVVSDGSTDDTNASLQEFAKGSNVQIILNTQSQGKSMENFADSAFTLCFSQPRGDRSFREFCCWPQSGLGPFCRGQAI